MLALEVYEQMWVCMYDMQGYRSQQKSSARQVSQAGNIFRSVLRATSMSYPQGSKET